MSEKFGRRWQTMLCLTLVVLGSANASLAGGGFIRRSPGGPPVVDISRRVMEHCSRKAEKRLPDGTLIEVMYPVESAALAASALGMMERLRDVLAGDLHLELPTGARVYVIELEETPASLMIEDHSELTAVFALMEPGWGERHKTHVLEREIFGMLAHEWTHAALRKGFPRRSAVSRIRWISEGSAGFFQYEVLRALSRETFDAHRAFRLPFFRLEETSLGSLCAWKHESVRPEDLEADPARDEFYGASLGLFLRVAEHGGVTAVWRMLDEFRKIRRAGPEETDEILHKVTGRRFSDLAAISQAERDKMYEEAVAALEGPFPSSQHYGLAVLARYPERADNHLPKIKGMVTDSSVTEGIRGEAAKLVAAQAPPGVTRSVLDALREEPGVVFPGRLKLPLLQALGLKDPACAVEGLLTLTSDEDAYTKGDAVRALQKVAGKEMELSELREWIRQRNFKECSIPPA